MYDLLYMGGEYLGIYFVLKKTFFSENCFYFLSYKPSCPFPLYIKKQCIRTFLKLQKKLNKFQTLLHIVDLQQIFDRWTHDHESPNMQNNGQVHFVLVLS